MYRIFDEDGSGDVDYKEIAVGIEFLAEGDSEDKIQRIALILLIFKGFFDICDVDNNGAISEKEFYDVLKLNIINDKDKKLLRQTVREVFSSVKKTTDSELSK